MVDIRDLAYLGDKSGWRHLSKISHGVDEGYTIPTETIEYFAKFANALLQEKKAMGNVNPQKFNDRIREIALEQLEILKPVGGRTRNSQKSLAEFCATACWRHASTVLKELDENPVLTVPAAIINAAENNQVDENTVRRAWLEAKKHPEMKFTFPFFSHKREMAQQQQLAESIASYLQSKSRLPKITLDAEIPKSVIELTKLNKADRFINIATITPSCRLQNSNDIAEVLAQCVLIDNGSVFSRNLARDFTAIPDLHW